MKIQSQEPSVNQFSIGTKVQRHHVERLAIVYVRQSTMQQVEHHKESTRLQYALVDRAKQYGWPSKGTLVIDDDLGISGATAEGRPGFQKLVAEVGMNHVGIILGIEMSRLARSCKDWHQLLEVCALFGTLIGDIDGVYDPSNHNDRLLLGLKGTISEAELHVIKTRMYEGKFAKAKRGELNNPLPIGYVRRLSGEVIKDLDEQVQQTIQLIFDKFRKFKTITGVLNYFVRNGIQLPFRIRSGPDKGEFNWKRPNRSAICHVLHNPAYAGIYVFGRYQVDPRKKVPGRSATGRARMNLQEWKVMIKDKYPAYITSEEYERNLKQIKDNDSKFRGVIRKGPSLLSGLLICGHCGRRMATQYTNNGKDLRYFCSQLYVAYGEEPCQSLVGNPLDQLVSELVLEAVQPAALEISLKVAEDLEKENIELQLHWKKRLERACYEVERARRQYNAVEPENRLVVRSLEKQWEEALAAEASLKNEYDRFLAEQSTTLSKEEREGILRLATDIPMLWYAPTTTDAERQSIIRFLIDHIDVSVQGTSEKVHICIHWAGGYQTEAKFDRPIASLAHMSNFEEFKGRLQSLLASGLKYQKVAETLNAEGWRSPTKQQPFTKSRIYGLVGSLGMQRQKELEIPEGERQKNEWTIYELADKLKMSSVTLRHWLSKGKGKVAMRSIKCKRGKVLLAYAGDEAIARLCALRDENLMKRGPKKQSLPTT